MTETSVVVPVHDGEATLAEQLDALVAQDSAFSYEVIVVNDHSTDASSDIIRSYVLRFPGLFRGLSSTGCGPSAARNAGAAAARGTHLLFCDADDRVSRTWVRDMTAALHSSSLVTGSSELFMTGPEGDRSTGRRSDLQIWHHVCPRASSANLGIDRELFDALGGFDESLRGTEDIDLCLKAHLAGSSVQLARATIAYRERSSFGALARQQGSYAYWDTVVSLRYSDLISSAGGVPPTLRSTVTALAAQLVHLDRLPRSFVKSLWIEWTVQLWNKWNRVRVMLEYSNSHSHVRSILKPHHETE